VSEKTETKDIQVKEGDSQVPDEVPAGEGLDHAAQARVAPDSLFEIHVLALLVDEHGPEGEAIDEEGLGEGDDMGVPVCFLCAVVLGVVLGKEEIGQQRGDDGVDNGVEGGGADNFVNVKRQGWKGETLGEGLDSFG